jgi:hypothetical protein
MEYITKSAKKSKDKYKKNTGLKLLKVTQKINIKNLRESIRDKSKNKEKSNKKDKNILRTIDRVKTFEKDKIKNDENKQNIYNETIFVCYFNKNDYTVDVECILKYFNPCFEEEIEKYISNRGGIEYFYIKKELKLDEGGIQNIIDTKTKNIIGNLINIRNPKNHFNLGRFGVENKIDNCNKNNEPGIPIKMSMFDNDEQQQNTDVLLTKNNVNYKNWNNFNLSNNNMFNQVVNNNQN